MYAHIRYLCWEDANIAPLRFLSWCKIEPMKTKPWGFAIVAGAALLTLGATSATWHGMIEAQPAGKAFEARGYSPLHGLKVVRVVLGSFPGSVASDFDPRELLYLVQARMHMLGIEVVTAEEAAANWTMAAKGSDASLLKSVDERYATFTIDAFGGGSAGEVEVLSLSIMVDRGVFAHPGYFTSATVYRKGTLMVASEKHSAEKITSRMVMLMDHFDSDWKKANR